MSGVAERKQKKIKRDAFTNVYNEYYPLVFNSIHVKVGNWDDANDICQEVFLILFEKFEEVNNYRKWLFGTLRYVTIRYFEKKSSKQEIDIDTIFNDVAVTFVNGMRDTRILISEAIDNVEMSEKERLLFNYIAFDNYTYNNVGKILGLSKKQVFLRYNGIVNKILYYLRNKGIRNIEDLL